MRVARFSGSKLYRRPDITKPALEKTRSHGDELAGRIKISQQTYFYVLKQDTSSNEVKRPVLLFDKRKIPEKHGIIHECRLKCLWKAISP